MDKKNPVSVHILNLLMFQSKELFDTSELNVISIIVLTNDPYDDDVSPECGEADDGVGEAQDDGGGLAVHVEVVLAIRRIARIGHVQKISWDIKGVSILRTLQNLTPRLSTMKTVSF